DSGKPQPRRPPHAAEGAYAVQQILMEAFASHPDEDLILAAFTAIVRHHGAFTSQLSDFRLIPQTVQYVAETLQLESLPLTLCDSPDSACKKAFSENLLSARTPEHSHALLLYLFLVRRLRVADQNSFKEE